MYDITSKVGFFFKSPFKSQCLTQLLRGPLTAPVWPVRCICATALQTTAWSCLYRPSLLLEQRRLRSGCRTSITCTLCHSSTNRYGYAHLGAEATNGCPTEKGARSVTLCLDDCLSFFACTYHTTITWTELLKHFNTNIRPLVTLNKDVAMTSTLQCMVSMSETRSHKRGRFDWTYIMRWFSYICNHLNKASGNHHTHRLQKTTGEGLHHWFVSSVWLQCRHPGITFLFRPNIIQMTFSSDDKMLRNSSCILQIVSRTEFPSTLSNRIWLSNVVALYTIAIFYYRMIIIRT